MKNLLKTILSACLALILPQELLAQNSNSLAIKIDSLLSNSVSNGYSGSVLVAKDREIIISKGYGLADRELKIPNNSSTVFNIGSVTKQFTAAAIMKLQEEGKLTTSDKIIKWFPDAPLDKHQITIHQLLTHTSGLSPQTGGFRYDKATKSQFLQEFYDADLMYSPGEKHTYANANYILLAAIVEASSGQDYESFLRDQFWGPLCMDRTGYHRVNFPREAEANGYYFDLKTGKWEDWGTTQGYLPGSGDHWYSIGKGDLHSTVEDLYRWELALEHHEILEEASRQKMETGFAPENEARTSHYGYGWAIYNSSRNSKIVSHNGSNGIYFADFIRFVE
ncbi:CubicO group peptidase, beta-lactamase class C family [Cyclobacterium lianum]|uniref:CubicO group peptidase, beta-lactamase class C family n=1 Tax=Cyclobacterium lianum TaxID=388280 RepID=A0A1M7JRS3_9BACT|nr:serine hydrolase domain-containing protein [Cyclobacterium lianum]SHM55742.1 CubicO group peptidase, beta-lactamase class C family [Cyclobacterium lianum]